MDRGRFRFEKGSLSNGPQLGRSQDMSSEMVHKGIGISILVMSQATIASSPNQVVHLSATLSLDTGLDNFNTTSPLYLIPRPPSPKSTCSDPLPLLCLHNEDWWDPAVGNFSLIEATRKRFRAEFRKLGRNIR